MKLTDVISQIQTDTKLRGQKKVRSAAVNAPASMAGRDRVELSSSSMDVRKIQEVLQETPEVRLDKVQELKEKIAGGEYHVDSRELADKMLTSLFSDLPMDK